MGHVEIPAVLPSECHIRDLVEGPALFLRIPRLMRQRLMGVARSGLVEALGGPQSISVGPEADIVRHA